MARQTPACGRELARAEAGTSAPFLSVNYRIASKLPPTANCGEVFHTYSAYARGLDILVGTYNFLDLAPKGRNEEEIMEWVRLHDQYGEAAGSSHCCSDQST